MKPSSIKKTSPEKSSSTEESAPTKKFPKIEKIDPDEKRKKEEKKDVDGAYLTLPAIISLEGATTSITKPCATTSLIKEISPPIVEQITLQKDTGKQQTNIVIQSKSFGEMEIELTMYDTNPYRFHIKIMGNEALQELTIKQQNLLAAKIKNALPRMDVHIAPPVLRKKDRFQVKEKKSVVKSTSTWYGTIKEE